MPISDLAFQTAKVVRRTAIRGEDGEPTYTEVTIVTAVPCRFDQGMARTLRNQISGSMRADQVAGVLYIDYGVKDDSGAVLDVKFKDQIFVDGDGPYEIYDLNKVSGYNALHHFELSLVDYRNK